MTKETGIDMTQTEGTEERPLRCRKCPDCGGIMLQTMCIAYKELVCVPCQRGVGIFNGLPSIFISHKEHDQLIKKYVRDIHKMAFEMGGATCNKCMKSGGNNCEQCNIEYEYTHKRDEE